MELKLMLPSSNILKLPCSNRTFMELKFVVQEKKGNRLMSSNRTFMELKSGTPTR